MPARLPAVDRRLVDLRHIDRRYEFPGFKDRKAWLGRAEAVRRQLRLALGLWPMPPRGELRTVVTQRIERDGYSIENIRFESHPGFFVTGNLYRPHPLRAGKRHLPALLVPHGHWRPDGRLVHRGPEGDSMPGLCINVALRGGIAFAIDMIGFNDSCQLSHDFGKDLSDHLALWGISLMGLQTFNAIRCLDFLLALPETDPARIAVTGASGGGTQTFILAALDERVTACAPAVMVSGIMQGGCLCENAPALRIDTQNMEISALAAPRPQLIISCSGDWTSLTPDLEFPAVRRIYALFGKDAAARAENYHQHAGHNYNRKSREALYGWLGRIWFGITDPEYAREKPFTVEPVETLRIFPDGKPPVATQDEKSIVHYLKGRAESWLEDLRPKDAAGLKRLRAEAGALWAQVLRASVPKPAEVLSAERLWKGAAHPFTWRVEIGRKGAGDLLTGVLLWPGEKGKKKARARLAIVTSNRGSFDLLDMLSGAPGPLAAALLAKGIAVFAADLFEATPRTGKRPRVRNHDGAYNAASLCHRVQDLLTAAAWAKKRRDAISVEMAGRDWAGGWVLLARALGAPARKLVCDAAQMDSASDEAYFYRAWAPGVCLAGGLPVAAALNAPGALMFHNLGEHFDASWARDAYAAAKAEAKLIAEKEAATPEAIAAWMAE